MRSFIRIGMLVLILGWFAYWLLDAIHWLRIRGLFEHSVQYRIHAHLPFKDSVELHEISSHRAVFSSIIAISLPALLILILFIRRRRRIDRQHITVAAPLSD